MNMPTFGGNPTAPAGVIASGVGPFATSTPTATTGAAFTCRAGVLRGQVNATGFNTSNTGIQVQWYLDGISVCYTTLSQSHSTGVHLAMSSGVFQVRVTAGTHYLYAKQTLGSSNVDDFWTFIAFVMPT